MLMEMRCNKGYRPDSNQESCGEAKVPLLDIILLSADSALRIVIQCDCSIFTVSELYLLC